MSYYSTERFFLGVLARGVPLPVASVTILAICPHIDYIESHGNGNYSNPANSNGFQEPYANEESTTMLFGDCELVYILNGF